MSINTLLIAANFASNTVAASTAVNVNTAALSTNEGTVFPSLDGKAVLVINLVTGATPGVFIFTWE